MTPNPYDDCPKSELLAFPGPWRFALPRSSIILVTDEELETLTDPDAPINLSIQLEPRMRSLRQICEEAQAKGGRTLIIAFDHFFRQYRPGQLAPRRLMPDSDEYIEKIAVISKFAAQYGLGLELSLLSPLEIGKAYAKQTGESGRWMHYRKGIRDPKTGAFSVQLWKQKRWCNNKGPIDIPDAGVRAFAFAEKPVAGTPFRVVNPDEIVEISDCVEADAWDGADNKVGDYWSQRVRIHGNGMDGIGDLNRVMIVQQYATPEMDYFSGNAAPFLHGLIDKYADAGVKLNGLYADEMHIQQDWNYFGHHEHGHFAMRYVSPGLERRYAERYGAQYGDLAKFMIYFAYGQDDFANDLTPRQEIMHVFGETPEAIRETSLFRARYFHLLQDGVVDLFADAKKHAENRMGQYLDARAHATWAESPTIDRWEPQQENQYRHKYEYTSNFLWSCTVHQASAACYDYFKWGDFLSGNGNDHSEGGWLDRNYWGLALGCSTGIINEIPYSYAGHWGSPQEIGKRRGALASTFGTSASPQFCVVQDMQHRDVDVLMLYPIDLVAAEERFGSWMSQYAYANYITQAKLLELGKVVKGAIEICGSRFTTLAATFEPFPSGRLLEMMKKLVESGGKIVWSGPPPVLSAEGKPILEQWQKLFGVDYEPSQNEGIIAAGKQIVFEGVLGEVTPQIVLTDFLVDRIFPVKPRKGAAPCARVKNWIVGTHKAIRKGSATVLGYRPRDDQSCSLGYDARNWFEVLNALGAYRPTGVIKANDNTEYISRTGDYLACRFPNGAVAIAPHLKLLEENWFGGFARNREDDIEYIKQNPPPSNAINLRAFKVNGHSVSYKGEHAVAFRVDKKKRLIAFAGNRSNKITIDGKTTVFADKAFEEIGWGPVTPQRRIENGAVWQLQAKGRGKLTIPAAGLPDNLQLVAEGETPGSRGKAVEFKRKGNALQIKITKELSGKWIFGVVAE